MIKLLTPLVIGTVLIVSALGLIHLAVFPDAWAKSLAAVIFLPLAIGILVYRARLTGPPEASPTTSGSLRAALVGGGVLLGAALLESLFSRLGWLPDSDGGFSSTLFLLLPALIAVAVDTMSARLEKKAKEESE